MIVARPLRKAYPYRSIRSAATRAALSAAEQRQQLFEAAFQKAIADLRASLPSNAVLADLLQHGVAGALDTLSWQVFTKTFGDSMSAAMLRVMEASAQAAAVLQPWRAVASTSPTIGSASFTMSFDLSNPAAISVAERHVAELVRNVDTDMRAAIRQVIVAGQRGEMDVRDQARSLREFIGLTERQATAVMTYRDTLLADGASPREAEARTTAYYDRSIASRAQTIARTETMFAANAGQEALWAEAVDRGFLTPDQEQEWITQPENGPWPCEICAPMDGQRRPLGEEFVSPFNGEGFLHPPAHPRCACTVSLAATEN